MVGMFLTLLLPLPFLLFLLLFLFLLMFFVRQSPRGGDKIVRRQDRGDPAAPRLGRMGAAIYAMWWKQVVTLPA